MTAATWTLVTVAYNSADQLRSAWTDFDPAAARWVVVDNASTDDSAAVAATLGARVIRLPKNVGFGAANNVALAQVDTDWIAFVNPDVTVGGADDLARLARVSATNQALVAPQLLNSDGSEQPNARGLPYLVDKVANRGVSLPGARLHDYARTGLSGPTFAAWTIGAALAGPTATFHDLGGWDERFFIYYEDHDLGLRAWRAGTPVVLDPEVRWSHGWQRATTRPSLTAWRHELGSMRTFYRVWPSLLTRQRHQRAEDGLGILDARLWQPAVDPA
jgi:N-acetylglucosaminyl-diphospho-decaprenol L-rhamnosyltransferase